VQKPEQDKRELDDLLNKQHERRVNNQRARARSSARRALLLLKGGEIDIGEGNV
jgi:hypothetical protein